MECPPTATDQVRPQLVSMAQEPDPYPFLTVVEDYLAAVPQDDQIRASVVGALTRKGLLSVAGEIARACPADSPNGSDMKAAAGPLGKPELLFHSQIALLFRKRAGQPCFLSWG